MATNFPTSLDTFTNPGPTDTLDSVTVPHAAQHDNLNDAVAALEAKVGVNGSAVTSSLDYKVSQLAVIQEWAFSFTNVSSSSAHAFKGVQITPTRNLTLYGLYYMGTLPSSGSVLQGAVFTVSGGNVASPTLTSSVAGGSWGTAPNGIAIPLPFGSPVSLTSGTTYIVGAGRTDSTGTAATGSMLNLNTPNPRLPWAWGQNATVDSTSITAGQAVTLTTATAMTAPGIQWL